MTEKVLRQIRELDAVAEKAGGYVLPPHKAKVTTQANREFVIMRKYSLDHKKPMGRFTDADYHAMGLTRAKVM